MVLGSTYVSPPEKKEHTDEISSKSTALVFSSTPETPEQILSETALTLLASSSTMSLAGGMTPMSSLASVRDTTILSAPWSNHVESSDVAGWAPEGSTNR